MSSDRKDTKDNKSETKDSKEVKELKGDPKEFKPLPDDDIPFRSNFTRPDNYRSLALHPAPASASQLLTSSFGNQFSYRGFAVQPGSLLSSKPGSSDWIAQPFTLAQRKVGVDDAKKGIGSASTKGQDVPLVPHWIDPNFSFDTLSHDILYEISRQLLEQRIDYEHVDAKYKIRGVVYEDNYNVEFSIRQYRNQDNRLYICEVQRKKSPVVPFSIFYKQLKERLGDLIYQPNKKKGSESRQLKTLDLFDDLADFKPDPVTAQTLAPFQTMLQSVHLEVQKEGLRAIVGLAAASEENVKAIIDCHAFTSKAGDDYFDWLVPTLKFLEADDQETVRLSATFLRHLCQYKHEKFREAVIKQCLTTMLKLLDAQSTLLRKEIHRQVATGMAGLSGTHSKQVLEATNAVAILSKHQYCQDYVLRNAVGQVLSSSDAD